ncbi:molybdopterin-guanine dinucleotide biosynthesis protein MobA [Prauserella marina]|uniref:Nicotine blue oxidoreductase n=1 Tax=Prauserella marina TaxID=530584 RepID=A0A222VMH7_9PSEU|nr:nucleotidyltransferase family protein [Prauserella marina]ASR35126.1 molybdopterin-guanine dinucleotide biosynthesis protein MobA [Prauserella marina]PWV85119.1 nicotine blue oxidoreductase [Prauserella marina]SDC04352.1 nicotine blue oxidoreductase [Prauserella marina]
MNTAGLLLAAGAGRRFGTPKALVEVEGIPLVARAADALARGGCDPVLVVLGARAEDAAKLVPGPASTVFAPDWADGMGASLRTGLLALTNTGPDAVLVHLVDLPGVGADVIARLRAIAGPDIVARAAYAGVPGHPVLFGANWLAEIAASLRGDHGARGWLSGRRDVRLVECGDIGDGTDVDTPADLRL